MRVKKRIYKWKLPKQPPPGLRQKIEKIDVSSLLAWQVKGLIIDKLDKTYADIEAFNYEEDAGAFVINRFKVLKAIDSKEAKNAKMR